MADQLSISEQIHFTNLWCREQGIKSRDLTNHPTIDDAIFLINFRNEGWFWMDSSDRGVWAAYWNRVYHKQFKLKDKHYTKLEKIAQAIIHRQQVRHQLSNKIKNLRHNSESNLQNGVVNMTANPTPGAEISH